jgi:carbon-monoxide dehydrogenase large subunit
VNAARRWVGEPLTLQQGRRHVRGKGHFIGDLDRPGLLHAAFVGSNLAHARIRSVDVSEARAHADAAAVLTAADLDGHFRPYWGGMRVESIRRSEAHPLARGRVRYVGEPVALVLARDRYAAEDVAELVSIDYEDLQPVVDPEEALAPGAPRLYDDWPDNRVYTDRLEAGPLDDAFGRAHTVISRRFRTNRHTGTPLETRGAIADWDSGNETLTYTANVQDVYLARTVLSGVLDLPPSRLRVRTPDSGGGFGVKLPVYQWDVALCVAARLLDRPIKWIQDRREDLLGTTQSRDAVIDAELALDADGAMLGLRARIVSDGGSYAIPARGVTVEGMMIAKDFPGPYKLGAYGYDLDIVVTNKPPLCVYRGVGLPITIFVLERLLDLAAGELHIDRVELRRRNLVKADEFPYLSLTGYDYEPGSYVESLELAADAVGYSDFPAEQERHRAEGRYLGLGIATANEAVARGAAWYGKRGAPISGQEGCTIKIDPTGKVYAQLGTTSQGQGLEQICAQLIADQLGLRPEDIRVVMGDTDLTPYGSGTWASRCAVSGGSATVRAARRLREKLLAIGAHLLEIDERDLELADGKVSARGSPEKSKTIEEIARTAYFVAAELPPGMEPALEETAHFEPPEATFSNSTHAVVVEVDPATGRLEFLRYVIAEDCGTIINPAIVHGQILGGLAQGIGGTIYEHSVFDASGQPLATSFMDYLVPTSLDMPRTIDVRHIETPSPRTEAGQKGVGESGVCYSPGAIANAVADALRPFGVDVTELPLSPSAVHALVAPTAAG